MNHWENWQLWNLLGCWESISLLNYIDSVIKTASKVAFYLQKSTLQPCIEYGYHVWACSPSCHSDMLDRLQKQIYKTVSHTLVASLEPLAHCRHIASVNLLYRYLFSRCSSELAELVPIPHYGGRSNCYSIGCTIFLTPFPDIIRMSMSTVSFLT